MIVIFAPTKLFNPNASQTPLSTMFQPETKKLVEKLKRQSKTALKNKYKLSNDMADTVYGYYKNFSTNESYKAIDFYKGESFKAFDYPSLSDEATTYLNQNVYILDALYGIIRPFDGIKPYRMDFTITGSTKMWKVKINDYFISLKVDTILSLASKEFSSLIDKDKFKLYDVSFVDCKDNQCKKITVFNKQQRGNLLRYVVDHQITSIDALPTVFNGYKKRIKNFEIIYEKTI